MQCFRRVILPPDDLAEVNSDLLAELELVAAHA
jgi:hypothetical protein